MPAVIQTTFLCGRTGACAWCLAHAKRDVTSLLDAFCVPRLVCPALPALPWPGLQSAAAQQRVEDAAPGGDEGWKEKYPELASSEPPTTAATSASAIGKALIKRLACLLKGEPSPWHACSFVSC